MQILLHDRLDVVRFPHPRISHPLIYQRGWRQRTGDLTVIYDQESGLILRYLGDFTAVGFDSTSRGKA